MWSTVGVWAHLQQHSTAYLLDGQESVDLPPQAVYGKALAHLSDLDEDKESGVYIHLGCGEEYAQLEI